VAPSRGAPGASRGWVVGLWGPGRQTHRRTVTMIETEYRQKMIKDANGQGHWARSINDTFNSAYPDIRLKVDGFPQIDMELKILRSEMSTILGGRMVKSGLRKLQQIEIRDMNKAGIPAIGLILVEKAKVFTFSTNMSFIIQESLDQWFHPYRHKGTNWASVVEDAFNYLKKQGHDYL
jgi:hypothetical protein